MASVSADRHFTFTTAVGVAGIGERVTSSHTAADRHFVFTTAVWVAGIGERVFSLHTVADREFSVTAAVIGRAKSSARITAAVIHAKALAFLLGLFIEKRKHRSDKL